MELAQAAPTSAASALTPEARVAQDTALRALRERARTHPPPERVLFEKKLAFCCPGEPRGNPVAQRVVAFDQSGKRVMVVSTKARYAEATDLREVLKDELRVFAPAGSTTGMLRFGLDGSDGQIAEDAK